MAVTLKNISRRMQVYSLDHHSFQDHASDEHRFKLIHAVTVRHARNGTLSAQKKPRFVPTSVTILAGETKSHLPNGVLECLAVKIAIERRELQVIAKDETEIPSPAEPKVSTSTPSKVESSSDASKDEHAPSSSPSLEDETAPPNEVK